MKEQSQYSLYHTTHSFVPCNATNSEKLRVCLWHAAMLQADTISYHILAIVTINRLTVRSVSARNHALFTVY